MSDQIADAISASIPGHYGPTPAGVTFAETRFAAAWNIQGDATRLPFAERSFDLVVTTRFLRHLDAPARIAVLRELARVSRGIVLVELVLGGLQIAGDPAANEREYA